jgi:hypothetical protein
MGTKATTPNNLSWVRHPVKIFLARKLSTIEEQRQERSCLFQRLYYKNKGNIHENVSWVLVLVKMVSVAR